jgi:S1-C subfamily serine protease
MKIFYASSTLLISFCLSGALAQDNGKIQASKYSAVMETKGAAVTGNRSSAIKNTSFDNLQGLNNEVTSNLLSKIAQLPISEKAGTTRSAKDAQIYRAISPSVVLIVNKEGLGSGSLLSISGDVITNYHVVKGYSSVAVIFKPTIEGKEPTRDEIKLGQVIKYDEVADLALVKVSESPVGRSPIRLGDSSEIAIGSDVHAIGHPTGEAWTYTTGVISQYRQAYEWQSGEEDIKHKADIIQTQTPINPGNSGGPLISDGGTLIGVNSFKAAGEGLNFAVSVDDVKKFLARTGNRLGKISNSNSAKKAECTPKEISRFRNKENNASIIAFDMFCTGKDTGEEVFPDKQSEAVFLRMDRNGDGKADVIFFDLKRRGKWDISWWDENYDGHWTLVGYHDDGSATPSRFESYAAYQRRLASNR